jgi:NitT/TauT family transport system permease protein
MAGVSAFFPVFVATFAAARQVRPVLLRVVKSFNATVWQTIRYVYLPALTVPIIGCLRLALGVAIIGTLLAEIKAAKAGLGLLLIESYNFFRIPEMYAILLIIFCFAMLANVAMDRLTVRLSYP